MAEKPDLFGVEDDAPASPEVLAAPETVPADPRADFERALATASPETRQELLARFDTLDAERREVFAGKFALQQDFIVSKLAEGAVNDADMLLVDCDFPPAVRAQG